MADNLGMLSFVAVSVMAVTSLVLISWERSVYSRFQIEQRSAAATAPAPPVAKKERQTLTLGPWPKPQPTPEPPAPTHEREAAHEPLLTPAVEPQPHNTQTGTLYPGRPAVLKNRVGQCFVWHTSPPISHLEVYSERRGRMLRRQVRPSHLPRLTPGVDPGAPGFYLLLPPEVTHPVTITFEARVWEKGCTAVLMPKAGSEQGTTSYVPPPAARPPKPPPLFSTPKLDFGRRRGLAPSVTLQPGEWSSIITLSSDSCVLWSVPAGMPVPHVYTRRVGRRDWLLGVERRATALKFFLAPGAQGPTTLALKRMPWLSGCRDLMMRF